MLDTLEPAPARRVTVARRAWAAPLWAHALALGAVLLVVLLAIGPGTYSADEGAAILEARSLADGGGWVVEHPLPEADPTGARYPLELSERGERGVAPYAKHPLYPAILSVADRVGGIRAMVSLSALGTVAAACAAATLARRLRTESGPLTMWVVGLGSPLLFDATWVVAHSLAAAAVGAAMVAALRAVEREQLRWSLLAGALLACAVGLRTEALFVAGAFALVGAWMAVRHRQRPWAVTAAAAGVASLGTRWLEARSVGWILGPAQARPTSGSTTVESHSFVSDRWAGFVQTWLRPGGGAGGLVLLTATILLAVAAWKVARGESGEPVVRRAAVAAAVLLVVRALVLPTDAVPGLLVAFPLLWVGFAVGARAVAAAPLGRLLGAVSGLAAVVILATQYRVGGTAEWGGRYFALLLPLAVPLAVTGLADRADGLPTDQRRRLGAALLAVTAAFSLLAVRELQDGHTRSERAVAAIERATDSLEDPVVVTTDGALPRAAWRTFGQQRWLLVDPTDPTVVEDLTAAGVDRFVLVSRDLDAAMAGLGGLVRVPGSPESGGIAVVEARR